MYKIGGCIQCGKNMVIRDCAHMIVSKKPWHREVDVIFEDGHKLRIPICMDCLDDPDFHKIKESFCADDSQSQSMEVKKVFNERKWEGCTIKVKTYGN